MEFLHNSFIVNAHFPLYRVQIKAVTLYWTLLFLWFPLCRSEAGLLVTPKFGYLSAAAVISRMMMTSIYKQLRMSRDGTLFVCSGVCESDPRIIQFALASCYAVHINALSI